MGGWIYAVEGRGGRMSGLLRSVLVQMVRVQRFYIGGEGVVSALLSRSVATP
jgi:hypothetical protein